MGTSNCTNEDPSQLQASEIDAFENEIYSMHDPETTDAARIQSIIDVKYAPQEITSIVEKCIHLTESEREGLHKVLPSLNHSLMELWGSGTQNPLI